MENYTTFLFGAGASAQKLPIVNQFEKRILGVIEKVESFRTEFDTNEPLEDDYQISSIEIFETLITDLHWLCEQSKNHASIDTYAKKLYLAGYEEEYERLKIALSAYLSLEQIINTPDDRYDYLYASILSKNSSSFPKNVKVISWNYDMQFELSHSLFSFKQKLSFDYPNSLTKFENSMRAKNNPFIYKVNGEAIYVNSREPAKFHFGLSLTFGLTKSNLKILLKGLLNLTQTYKQVYCGISFAWETDSDIVNETKKGTNKTQFLVVIGYSFPFFNREIDKELLENMKGLKKVYFQAPDPTEMIERFQAIRPDISVQNLVPIKGVSQFYLPNELSLEY